MLLHIKVVNPAIYISQKQSADTGGVDNHVDMAESVALPEYGDVQIYGSLITPTLPIPLSDFKSHVTQCHSDYNKEFSKQFMVIYLINVTIMHFTTV